MEIIALFILAFSVFVGVGVHKSDIKKETALKVQITELKTTHNFKPKKLKQIKIVKNQNIEVMNLGDA